MAAPGTPASRGSLPSTLLVAIAVVAAEGLALLGVGCWLGYDSLTGSPDNGDVAAGSAVFFLVLGLILLGVAEALRRRQSWAGGASLFLQLLALAIVWEMIQERFWIGAIPLLVGAVAALVALMGARTRDALGR